MKLITCKNNHFYDADKFDSCPHCATLSTKSTREDLLGLNQHVVDTDTPECEKLQQTGNKNTVGWLVCIEGNMQGKSFVLTEGDNYIGRGSHMDICLSNEPTVSRDTHAIITYNIEQNSFSFSSPEHANSVLYNDTLFEQSVNMKTGDHFFLGKCHLLFVALCNQIFNWKDI